jgi:type IV pilus assembly protein PilC
LKTKNKKKKAGTVYLKKISPIEIALSIRHMALMLKSGMSLTDIVDSLAENIEDERLKAVYQDIDEKIHQGESLSKSMKSHPKVFSQTVRSIVEVGEESGNLEENLLYLTDLLKQQHTLNKKVKGALFYPVVVFGLVVAELFGMVFFIFPKLEDVFEAVGNVPEFTQFIINMFRFFRQNVIFIGLGFLLIGLLLYFYFRSKKGRILLDKLSLNTPIIRNLVFHNYLTNFSRTCSILLKSGIPLPRSLKICSETINSHSYTEALKDIYKSVQSGKNLNSSIAKYPKLFPRNYGDIIEVGESSGTLEENFNYLYEYHSAEVESIANNFATIIEPILLVFVGVMIGLAALTIIGPIYQLTGNLNP